ncbi:MFS transporter [Candidatus Peregrinibacteria bacterium]|nr:MFS transporter [Candidatus Peregrinibacteria bacterium]
MKQKGKPIRKNVFWMSTVSYFTDFSSEMLMPILPVFYESLGINKTFIGIIEGFAESFSNFIKVFSGYISDKIKKRKLFIVAGYSIPALIKPFYIFATGWLFVFIVRFIERSGKGFRDPPRDALIASSSEKKFFGLAFGFQRMMDTMGAVTGVLVLSIILFFFPGTLKPLFLIAFIPGVISFSIAARKVKEDHLLRKNHKTIKLTHIRSLPGAYMFFLIPTFIFAIGNMSYAFFILRAQDLGLSVALVPIIYLLYTVTYAVTAIPAGKLSDKIGKIPTLIMGNMFFIAACTLYMITLPIQFSWVPFILYGLFFAFNISIAKAYITTVVHSRLHATAIGLHNFIIGICALPASFFVGYLWDTFGVRIAFGYSIILAGISALLYLFMLFHPKGRVR